MRTLSIFLTGLALAAIVYLATGGHVVLIPILLILPFGPFSLRRP